MKIKILLIIILYSSTLAINLNDAYQSVIGKSPKLEESKLKLESTKYAINKAESSLYPQLSWSGTLQREKIDSSVDNDDRLTNNKLYNFNINQVIYNSNINIDITKSQLTHSIEKLNDMKVLQEITLELSYKYFEWLKAYKQGKIAKKNFELYSVYKKKIEKLFTLELSSKTDLLKSISGFYESKLEMEFVNNDYKEKKRLLEKYIRTNISENISIATDIEKFTNIIKEKNINIYLEDITQNIEMQILKINTQLQKQNIKKVNKSWYPTVNLVIDHSKTSRDDDSSYENTNGKIQIQSKLYQGGYLNASKLEAKSILKSYKIKEIYTKEDLVSTLTSTYFEFVKSKNKYLVSLKKLDTLYSELEFLNQSSNFELNAIEEILSIEKQILDIKLEGFASLLDSLYLHLSLNTLISSDIAKIINDISLIIDVKNTDI